MKSRVTGSCGRRIATVNKKDPLESLEPVAATTAKTNFGEILHQVSVEGRRILINRSGRPVAVILSYRDYFEMTHRPD